MTGEVHNPRQDWLLAKFFVVLQTLVPMRLFHLKRGSCIGTRGSERDKSRSSPPIIASPRQGLPTLACGVLALFACAILPAQEFSFHYLGIAEGLNNLAVRDIYQGQSGFIWVNTENGIYRYDGDRFEFFGPPQGIPLALDVSFGDAPDGSLLVGAQFGLYRLSGNRFSQVAGNFTSVSETEGIQADGKGHTWLATDIGLVELTADAGQTQFSQQVIPRAPGSSSPAAHSLLLDGDAIWYGCGDEICHIDGRGLTSVLGREAGLPAEHWQAIKKDRDGSLWVSGNVSGIMVRAEGQAKFSKPNSPEIAGSLNGIPSLDADNRIILTSPSGLMISTRDGWHRIDRSTGLHGAVYSVFEDRQQSLWLGLAGRGLVQWRGYRQWESYTAESGLGSDVVFEILPEADRSLWVATQAGVYHGVRKQFAEEWTQLGALANRPAHSLQKDQNGNLWVGTTRNGIARVHLSTGTVSWYSDAQGLTGKGAFTIRFDREHRLWAATDGGLFVSSPPYEKFARVTEIPQTLYWTVTEDSQGVVWAGGSGGLFGLIDGHWHNWTKADGLSNQEVLALGSSPSGALWIGYSYGGGIDRVHLSGTSIRIEKGVQRTGTTGIIYYLDFDSAGRLWAGSDHGVDMWNGSRWSHYDMNDGLAWDDCDLNAFAQEPNNGPLWFGTSGGLSRFNPRPRATTNTSPQVVFTRVLSGQTDVSGLQNPSFGAGANSLSVQYTALNNPAGPNNVSFRYRMNGESSDWTETTRRELEFVHLAPGQYRLQIQAGDGLGNWSGHVAEYAFTIRPPWYKTWWFMLLCIIVPVLSFLGFLRLRDANVHARERELVRLVEEKTADLQRVNEELVRLSATDALTGLANRRCFDQTLEKECARRNRSDSPLSLVLFDVDHFKALNDSLGHQRGDVCLTLLAGEMNRIARRAIDVVARFGGEEFAMILPNTSVEGARRIAEMVRRAVMDLNVPHPASPGPPFLTVSAGVACAKGGQDTPQRLVAAADRALYAAKAQGRNLVIVAPELPNSPAAPPSQPPMS
jgi:diguanylate cyclase (GGDEF)-like protein